MKRNFYGSLFICAVVGVSAALIGACGQKVVPMSDVTVDIKFKDGCPKSVDKDVKIFDDFEVDKSNHIIWQASDPKARYKIYFNPFNDQPLESDDSGKLRSPDFINVSPAVVYKYTIVAEGCKDKPLDPRFRLR